MGQMADFSKDERFTEFLKRLAEAPPVGTSDEAFKLLSDTLNEAEDELTDIPFNPETWQTDGRMYPPQEDSARDVPSRDDLLRYRSKAHSTYIRANGAIEIRDSADALIFAKNGMDGKGVDL